MHIVANASRKGGSGKTTLTGHIAVEAESRGAGPVAMMDTDPQGSLADWWNERGVATPVFVQTTWQALEKDLHELREMGIALLVIDTPPAITGTIREVIGVFDPVVIPTRPSPHDLRSASTTVALVESLGKPLVFVVNAATPRARITAQAISALSRHGPMAPSIIHHRIDFAASMMDGRAVMEVPATSRSAEEIGRLWDYLSKRLNRNRRSSALPFGISLGAFGGRYAPGDGVTREAS